MFENIFEINCILFLYFFFQYYFKNIQKTLPIEFDKALYEFFFVKVRHYLSLTLLLLILLCL
ncbi:hypothetical protein C0075_24775 [Rhizobium sp. KAs_5_22]|nr:hypothetical protein C0075_24775 [Rhizobium sp. KAs_5_22]